MCECNLKNANLEAFLKKERKKRIWAYIKNYYSWIWVCLKSEGFKKYYCGAYFFQIFKKISYFWNYVSTPIKDFFPPSFLKGGLALFNQAKGGGLAPCPPSCAPGCAFIRILSFKLKIYRKISYCHIFIFWSLIQNP